MQIDLCELIIPNWITPATNQIIYFLFHNRMFFLPPSTITLPQRNSAGSKTHEVFIWFRFYCFARQWSLFNGRLILLFNVYLTLGYILLAILEVDSEMKQYKFWDELLISVCLIWPSLFSRQKAGIIFLRNTSIIAPYCFRVSLVSVF